MAGYTLIELITVVMILGILSSFVVVDQVSYYRTLTYAADVEKFIGDMEYARDYALARKKRCVISIIAASGPVPASYTFNLEKTDAAGGAQVILPHNSGNHSIIMPDGASISEADVVIVLDRRGRPQEDVSLTYTSTSFSSDVTVAMDGTTGYIGRQ